MSKELWEDNLALWQTQDKMNELHSKRIDELTQAVKKLAELLTEVVKEDLSDLLKTKSVCGGKHCSCKGN